MTDPDTNNTSQENTSENSSSSSYTKDLLEAVPTSPKRRSRLTWRKKNKSKSPKYSSNTIERRVSNTLEKKIIGIDKRPTIRLKSISKRTVMVLALGLLLLSTGTVFYFQRKLKNKVVVQPQPACSSDSDVYGEMASAIHMLDYEKARKASDKIQSDKNYANSPNCMAGLTSYFLFTGDIIQAKDSYSKLKKVAPDDYRLNIQYSAIGIEKVSDFNQKIAEENKEMNRIYESSVSYPQ